MIRSGFARPRIASAADWLAAEGLLIVVTAVVLVGALVRFRMFDDSWYTLLGGRLIAEHGLPAHDTLALWTHGRAWVDQQWLAQIAGYGAFRLGGIRLFALCDALIVAAAFGIAILAARRRGASARAVAWIAVIVLLPFYVIASNPRAQTLAFVLFVLELWLLTGEWAERSRRLFLVLPLLVVWANVHGSVVLGAALVALRGLVELVRARGRSRRGALLLVLPWLCVFASPYGFQLAGYYRTILVGSGFSNLVTEWAPTTLNVVTAPLYLTAAGAIWLIGRSPRSFPVYERVLLFVLIVVALSAIRNVGWFALAALVLLPRPLDEVLRAPREASRLVPVFNKVLSVAAVLLVVAVVPSATAHAERSIDRQYPQAAANRVASSARCLPRVAIFADVTYADWLLWAVPTVDGRVAFDARLELLHRAELRSIVRVLARVEGWRKIAARYDMFVVDANDERSLRRSLVRALGFRPIYLDSRIAVLRRAGIGPCRR